MAQGKMGRPNMLLRAAEDLEDLALQFEDLKATGDSLKQINDMYVKLLSVKDRVRRAYEGPSR